MTKQVLPLLQTYWGQDNTSTPNDFARMVSDLGSWTNDNIGCQCLALAQILFYHKVQPHCSDSGYYICTEHSGAQPDRIVSLTFGENYFFPLFGKDFSSLPLPNPDFSELLVQSYLFDVAKAYRKNFYVNYLGTETQRIRLLMTHFDVEAQYYQYEVGTTFEPPNELYEDLNGDLAGTIEDAKQLIKRELANNRPVWMYINRESAIGTIIEGHAVVIDGFKEEANGTFWICIKWGNGSAHDSDPNNPNNPPWFEFEKDIGSLNGKQRRLITIRPTRQSPRNILHRYEISPTGELGNCIEDQEWSSGWTTSTFYSIGTATYLLLLKNSGIDYDGRNVHIRQIEATGSVGETKIATYNWSEGWTSANLYTTGSNNYLFLLKKTGLASDRKHNVIIHGMNTDGTVGTRIADYSWSEGWTTTAFYAIGSATYLFLLKEIGVATDGINNVIVHRINTDGTVGSRIADYNWSEGWTTAKFYTIGSTTYLVLIKEIGLASDGKNNVIIHRMNADGTVGDRIADYNWSEGWTTTHIYTIGSTTYLFLLKKRGVARDGKNSVVIHRMNGDGTVGDRIANYNLSEGWTTANTYNIGSTTYLFLMK